MFPRTKVREVKRFLGLNVTVEDLLFKPLRRQAFHDTNIRETHPFTWANKEMESFRVLTENLLKKPLLMSPKLRGKGTILLIPANEQWSSTDKAVRRPFFFLSASKLHLQLNDTEIMYATVEKGP